MRGIWERTALRRGVFAISTTIVVLCGLSVIVSTGPVAAATATFSSSTIGTNGQTPSFSQTGPWTMAWSYNCSNYGSPGNFIVTVNGSFSDNGTNELNSAGSGIDYYYDTGTFSLSIESECD
ncbi:MAG TPA: hypothetical protein VEJ87_05120, partial [Acidimicrobiales bacterium]|nr:hypothetical protein [Acidimicrobiales bacterium]